jgi:hypothetical protein
MIADIARHAHDRLTIIAVQNVPSDRAAVSEIEARHRFIDYRC